jgi:catechol 2,3-dioxygenase-like lactoylglutathione lyase family enzyme
MPDFPPLQHVALTVADRSVSVPWYQRLFGSEPVLDEDTGPFHHVVFKLGDTLFGLHTHPEPPPAGDRFDEHRLGLDHVSFGVANRAELETWAQRLDELGIAHGDIKDASYGSGVSFRDPDNNALEFFCLPGA